MMLQTPTQPNSQNMCKANLIVGGQLGIQGCDLGCKGFLPLLAAVDVCLQLVRVVLVRAQVVELELELFCLGHLLRAQLLQRLQRLQVKSSLLSR